MTIAPRTSLVRLSRLSIVAALTATAACGDDETPVTPAPTIEAFTASSMAVEAGATVNLAWSTTNTTRVVITDSGGGTLADTTSANGMVPTPALTETLTFTLVATGDGGSAMASVTVTVNGPADPVVDSFTASATMVTAGDTVTLRWATTGAETVEIATDDGTAVVTAGAATGMAQVMPTNDVTYTLTAESATGATATAQVSVTVTPAPVAPTVTRFEATPDVLDPGQTTTLGWEVTGTTPVMVTITDGAGGTVFSGTELTGTQAVSPLATTTYNLVATNVAGSAMGTETVTVNPPMGASVVSFDAVPARIAPGEAVTLTWETTNATRVLVETTTVTISDSAMAMGSALVTPDVTTTYTLTAFNSNGDAMAAETVTVTPIQPAITAFSASPTFTVAGSTTSLSWTVMMAQQVRLLRGTTVLATTSTGSLSVPVTAGANEFTLEALNPGATATQSVTVVGAPPPTIVAFSATPPMAVGTTTVALAWDVRAVSTLTLTANGSPVPGFPTITTSTVVDASGTLPFIVAETTTFELNGDSIAGSISDTLTVTFTAPPVIDTEPNDDFGTAQNVPAGSPVTGSIATGTDEDWYSFTVPGGGNVYAETSDGMGACPFDTVISLYAPDGTTRLVRNDDGGTAACSRIDPASVAAASDLPGGRYFIRVESFSNRTGNYVLDIRVGSPSCGNGLVETSGGEQCDDTNTLALDGCSAICELEAENTYSGPAASATFTGSVDPLFDVDVVRLTVTSTAYLAAETSTAPGACNVDTLLTLYESDGITEIGEDDADGVGSCSRITPGSDAWALLAPGAYWLVLREDGNDATLPSVDLTVELRSINTCGNGVTEASEACDDGNTASGDGCSATCTIELAGSYTAPGADAAFNDSISVAGEIDTYGITVTSTAYVSIETLTSAAAGTCNADTQLNLRDATGGLVEFDDDDGVGLCSLIRERVLGPGSYTVAINEFGNNGTIAAYDILFSSVIANVCGNGVVEGTEVCDDGNVANGDGCSSMCTLEATIPLEMEPNNTATTANSLTLMNGQVTVRGALTANDEDFFEVVVAVDSVVSAQTYGSFGSLNSCNGDTVLELLDSTGATLLATDDDGGFGTCSAINGTLVAAGTYLVRVVGFAGGAVSGYFLDVNASAAPTPPAATTAETEPNDSTATAQSLGIANGFGWVTIGASFTANDDDVFSFTVPAGQTVTFVGVTHGTLNDFDTCPTDTVLALLNSSGGTITSGDDTGFGTCSAIQATLSAGTYYVESTQFSGSAAASYLLSVLLY